MTKASRPPRSPGTKSQSSPSSRRGTKSRRSPSLRRTRVSKTKRTVLPKGYRDLPGFATLPNFSRLLSVGNQYSAAVGNFDVVVSTVTPLDEQGGKSPELSSH